MHDVLILPAFDDITFDKNKKYGYGTSKSQKRKNLKNLLLNLSDGYCMYCFKRIVIDGDNSFGELEHTIEKDFGEKLKECHYNIAIACRHCNSSRKKAEQEQRKINTKYMRCNKEKCKEKPCQKYLSLKYAYVQNMKDKNLGKIILQPFGVQDYRLIFDLDLFEFSFLPNATYTNEDIEYIQSHISKFKLNDPDLKTKVLKEVLDDIIYYEKLPRKDKKYENLIGNLFVNYLYGLNMTSQELVEYCLEKSIDLIISYE
ncbi:MAG: hypothetical protein ACRCXT_08960 [Paraclostridium sp.]